MVLAQEMLQYHFKFLARKQSSAISTGQVTINKSKFKLKQISCPFTHTIHFELSDIQNTHLDPHPTMASIKSIGNYVI